jgi:hypothetical protein
MVRPRHAGQRRRQARPAHVRVSRALRPARRRGTKGRARGSHRAAPRGPERAARRRRGLAGEGRRRRRQAPRGRADGGRADLRRRGTARGRARQDLDVPGHRRSVDLGRACQAVPGPHPDEGAARARRGRPQTPRLPDRAQRPDRVVHPRPRERRHALASGQAGSVDAARHRQAPRARALPRRLPAAPHPREPAPARLDAARWRDEGQGLRLPRRRSRAPRVCRRAAPVARLRRLPAPRGPALPRGGLLHVERPRPRPRRRHAGREQDQRPAIMAAGPRCRPHHDRVEGVPRAHRRRGRHRPLCTRVRQPAGPVPRDRARCGVEAARLPALRGRHARAVARGDEDAPPRSHPRHPRRLHHGRARQRPHGGVGAGPDRPPEQHADQRLPPAGADRGGPPPRGLDAPRPGDPGADRSRGKRQWKRQQRPAGRKRPPSICAKQQQKHPFTSPPAGSP